MHSNRKGGSEYTRHRLYLNKIKPSSLYCPRYEYFFPNPACFPSITIYFCIATSTPRRNWSPGGSPGSWPPSTARSPGRQEAGLLERLRRRQSGSRACSVTSSQAKADSNASTKLADPRPLHGSSWARSTVFQGVLNRWVSDPLSTRPSTTCTDAASICLD